MAASEKCESYSHVEMHVNNDQQISWEKDASVPTICRVHMEDRDVDGSCVSFGRVSIVILYTRPSQIAQGWYPSEANALRNR